MNLAVVFFSVDTFSFSHVVLQNLKSKYDGIKWCAGNTGYPIMDSGMSQLQIVLNS
jgi:deoxyribodipyrimidine photo-lyase